LQQSDSNHYLSYETAIRILTAHNICLESVFPYQRRVGFGTNTVIVPVMKLSADQINRYSSVLILPIAPLVELSLASLDGA
jgi:hypothetical protein